MPPGAARRRNRRAVPGGLAGAVALLLTLLGAFLWLRMATTAWRLGNGLLEARSHLDRAAQTLSTGALKQARYATLSASAAARGATDAYRAPDPLLDLARLWGPARDAAGEVGHLVRAASFSARAVSGSFEVAQSALKGPNPIVIDDPLDPTGSKVRIERVQEIGNIISSVRADVGAAVRELAAVDVAKLPSRVRPGVAEGLHRARKTSALLASAEAGFRILPRFLGAHGPRNYLLGFQNPAEQRGTGGAILQFAVLKLDRGRPHLVDPSTVYNIDVNRRQVSIPLPRDAWYVRGIPDAQRFGNANWSPDWPLSARLTVDYARATSTDFPRIDGVIAVDPNTMQSAMPGVGRFKIRSGNVMTQRKIVHFVLYKAYASYPIAAVRRVVLHDVVTRFFDGLLHPDHASLLAEGLGRALAGKHMQIWLDRRREEAFIERMGWDGAVEASPADDYLYVVEQNVGGNKLDYFSDYTTAMSIELAGRDALVSTKASIHNNVFLPQPRWSMGDSGPDHRAMINVYVPRHASLLRSRIEGARLASPDNLAGGRGDRPAQHFEKGKKVWTATVQIPPQRRGSVHYDYRVPGVVRTIGRRRVYRLTIQHQPKTRPEMLRLRIRLPARATHVQAEGWSRHGRELLWHRPLAKDLALRVSWKQPT